MSDWIQHDHFVEHKNGKWRITKTQARIDSKMVLRYRAWSFRSGAWTPAKGTFETAREAAQHLGDLS